MTQPTSYDVTILVNDVDVTQYVPAESMSLDDYARQVSTFRFTIENPSSITPQQYHEVKVTANSLPDEPFIFVGYIFELKTRKRDNGITMIYECDCQDRKALLQRTIIGGNDFTGSDADILGDLLGAAYPDLSDLFDFSTDVNSILADLDFTVEDGTNLLDSLNDLSDLVGAELGFENVATSTNVVTFDPGGFADYAVSDTGLTSSETTGGNPDNCFLGTAASHSAGQRLTVDITLPVAIDIYDVGLDIYLDKTGTSSSGTWDLEIYNGGSGGTILFSGTIHTSVTDDATWHSYIVTEGDSVGGVSIFNAGKPFSGDFVRIQARPGAGHSGVDIRVDNLVINPGDGEPITELEWSDEAPAADFDIDIQAGDEYASDIDFNVGSLDSFNSVTVIGGYEEVTIEKALDNDGVRDHIALPYPVKALAVYTNTGTDTTPTWGSALALGAWGSDTLISAGGTKDVLLDAENNVLMFNTAPSNLVNAYKITGTIQRPIRVRVENVADGEPTLATSYVDEKITSIDQAVAIAQGQLEQKNATRQLSFKTNHPGLRPGQSIAVTDSARGLAETVTIRRISTTWQGKLGFFEVDCGDDDENSVDAIIANNDRATRASGITTSPDTQTMVLLTDDSGVLMTDDSGDLMYYIA